MKKVIEILSGAYLKAKKILPIPLRVLPLLKGRIVWKIHEWRLRTAMNRAIIQHKELKKQCSIEKENVNYIVILEIPVKRRGRVVFKETLYWLNRDIFREVKRRGWVPKHMKLDEFRSKSIYYTNLGRTYEQEYKAKERAMEKYKKFLKL
jgi:hypothetical protein